MASTRRTASAFEIAEAQERFEASWMIHINQEQDIQVSVATLPDGSVLMKGNLNLLADLPGHSYRLF